MSKTKSRNMFRLLLSGGGDHFTGVAVAPAGVDRLLSERLVGALAAAALPESSVTWISTRNDGGGTAGS